MKRIMPLLLALALLACLLPAQAGATAPELKTFTVLGTHGSTLTYEEAVSTHTWEAMVDLFAAKGVRLDITPIQSDQYLTVLQARIASNDIPDFFQASSLGTANCINLIQSGKIMAIDDLLPLSDGTAAYAL
nr:hypothetical protein [Clostridia bacterium]